MLGIQQLVRGFYGKVVLQVATDHSMASSNAQTLNPGHILRFGLSLVCTRNDTLRLGHGV